MGKELWICPLAHKCYSKLPHFKHCEPHENTGAGCYASNCKCIGNATCVPIKQEPDWEV